MAPEKKSPTNPSDKAEWLILNSVENAKSRKHILGSVVPKNAQYNPFDNYSPHWDDGDLDQKIQGREEVTKRKLLQSTMQKLWSSNFDRGLDESTGKEQSISQDKSTAEDSAVQLNDILTGRVAAKTKGMRAAITDLFDLFIKKKDAEDVTIESGSVKRYTIDNPGAKVEDCLIPCAPWKEQLQKLFNRTTAKEQKSPFFIVTGVLICENLKVRWKRKANNNTETTSKVDGNAILAAAHQPPNPELAKHVDIRFNFDQEKSTKEYVFATCKHDVIFALRYNYLNLSFEKAKEPNLLTRFLVKSVKPGTIKSAMMGGVFLGTGIESYAAATTTENQEDGEDVEGEDEDDSDWFYLRPKRDLGNRLGDQSDDASGEPAHQNGSATAHLNSRAGS